RDRAIRETGLQRDLKCDQNLSAGRDVKIANINNTCALSAARAAGCACVCARWRNDERKCAGHEYGVGVESIEFVNDPEIAECLSWTVSQRIAQLVTARGCCSGINAGRDIGNGLFKEVSRDGRGRSERVLVVQSAGRTVR